MAGTPCIRTLLIAALFLLVPGLATACPFCTMQGSTLTDEVRDADLVLFGTLQNPKLSATGGEFGEGTTELVIEAIVKKHAILEKNIKKDGDRQIITLKRYLPSIGGKKYKFLVFGGVLKDQIDAYRGVAVAEGSDAAKYLTGALTLKDKDVPARLRFFFDYLDDADVEISNDAYKEFGNADYKDFREMAKALPADKVAKWLQDPRTPAFRYGLYASILGHAGNEKHAPVLKAMLDDPEKKALTGVDGILAGYTMLKPTTGWAYITGILNDRNREFSARYAALRAVRFFWDSRPDVIAQKDLLAGVEPLLNHEDISDLLIEDLRKWKEWGVVDRVLALRDLKSHDIPIIRRAILRYALSCPKPQAETYVKNLRQSDPQLVRDVEELLKLETAPPPPTPSKK